MKTSKIIKNIFSEKILHRIKKVILFKGFDEQSVLKYGGWVIIYFAYFIMQSNIYFTVDILMELKAEIDE